MTGPVSPVRCTLVGCAVLFSLWTSRAAQAQLAVGGVYVDPQGMVRETAALSKSDLLERLRIDADNLTASGDVANSSSLRMISLRQLEAAVGELHAADRPLPPEIRFLAGLQGVRYVFFYPERGDVVLAGPAETWHQLPTGDIVGKKSGRPVMHLDDLVVALRYAFADNPADGFIGCSIEPTDQGMQAYAGYMSGIKSMDRERVAEITRGMEQAMGAQQVKVYGIPPESRFALQLIAADYRLKRLALAHDPSPSRKVPSYLDILAKSVTGGPQQQHRWWFVGHYAAIRHTADNLAYEFEGPALRVQTAPTGAKPAAANEPKPSKSATLFAEAATRGIGELAEKIAPFAELQNLVALSVAAALIRQRTGGNNPAAAVPAAGEGLEVRDYSPGHFLDESACPIGKYAAPRQTPSLANARLVKDRHWIFSVSGGVEIIPASLATESLKPATGDKLAAAQKKTTDRRAPTQWWWD